ncbi:ABC transporter permease [Paenibacillus sp. IITD108]|uniref:ABC transporter permease n=1 Tax=Paenibacillus sp. IITD108 TaxID=3116649 RepID=UPI002F3E5BF7
MLIYVAKRIFFIVIALVIISLLTFTLMQFVPGNFLELKEVQLRISGSGASQELNEKMLKDFQDKWGLNEPQYIQFLKFLKGAFTWDFGPSYQYPDKPMQELIMEQLPISLKLALFAVALALLIGIPIGILAAVKQNSAWDFVPMGLSVFAMSIPAFIVGVLLILLLSLQLKWLPTQGWGNWYNYIIPVVALSAGPVAIIARYIRSSLIEQLRQDYVTSAWAKGGNFKQVVFGHALRNSLIPLVTIMGPMISGLIASAVVVEVMFLIPGMGINFAGAAGNRDLPMLMSFTFVYGIIVMIANFMVDIAYTVIDPRIRYQRTKGGR